MWELDHKDNWVSKNWCFWNVVLEKTLESPLDCKVIKPVNPKGNQFWIFTGRTDTGAEVPIFWLLDVKNWLFGKDLDAGKDWRREEKGMPEDETVGWYHQLDGHDFEQTSGVGDRQESLACCSPWTRRVGRNWATELNWLLVKLLSFSSTILFIYMCVCVCVYIYIYMLRIPRKRKDQVTMLSWVTWQNERKQ